jgi:hypothetical protein
VAPVLATLLLVVACAPTTTPTPSPTPSPTPPPPLETLTYNSSGHGFSVEYPKDWKVRAEFMGTIVTFVGPVDEPTGGGININIGATQLAGFPVVTLEEYVRTFQLEVEANAENYEKVDEYDAVVGDLPAILWTWKEDFYGNTVMVTMAFFMKEDFVYAISYGATPKRYYDYLGYFELALDSFKFDQGIV